MPRLPLPGKGRARATLLVLAVLVVALVVAVLTVNSSSGPSARRPIALPAGDNTALPAEIAPIGAPAAPQSRRPNIVMVMADDMRADDLRFMPNVRRLLGGTGLTFRNSFSPYPLCCPARASFLTGEYAHNHHVFSHHAPWGFQAFDDRRTLATAMNDSGYNTVFIGKYLNGYGVEKSLVTGQPSFRYVPRGWTDWYGAVSRPPNSGYPRGGTYNYLDTLFNINGNVDTSHRGQYQTDVLGGFARSLVRKYHRSPRPFFMYLSSVAPHFGEPFEKDDPRGIKTAAGLPERIKTPARPPWVRGRFDKEITRASGLPKDGGPSERDVSDKPRPMNQMLELTHQERIAVRDLTRQRAEALFVLDRQVERLVQTLKATDEYRNTIIMFTSDNGYFLGEHRMRQGKIKPHEPSLRVPFLIAGKGIPHGTRFDPVTTPGITATIADLAHARMPFPADGVSVAPSLRGDRGWTVPVVTEGREDAAVFRHGRGTATGFDDPRTTIGIRTPRWKYVRYDDGDGELYDLDADPNELQNRYGDPRYAAVVAELQKVWLRYKDCKGATCRAPMRADLQRGPAQDRAGTDKQSRGVQARYGYWR
jgi:arylsulfatase A-like enzyme